jgi:pre-mRNA-processing factor 6
MYFINNTRYRKENPTIQQQFADLKRGLSEMTDADWAEIPEVGDLTRKKGKKGRTTESKLGERYSAIPDSILVSNFESTKMDTSIEANTPLPSNPTLTDFVQFGQARDKVLGLKLDQMSDSVTGQSTVDPKGYLTDLSSVILKSDAEISDIKKARTLLKSVIVTNPSHAPGWIAAARLEEFAGKMAAARDIMKQGCAQCPSSEDVWLEAARLNLPPAAKAILAASVKHIPDSVKIWLKAASLETESNGKKRVLRRALEFIPNSFKLWKAVVSLEDDPQNAKILLSRAVECVPLSVELWLALARLETYDNAKKVLNKARISIPTSHEIWIAAAKLEETQGNDQKVEMIIQRGVTVLSSKGGKLDREGWIKEAEAQEKDASLKTCRAIIHATIGMGVEEEDQKVTWMEDAETCAKHGSILTARSIYEHAAKILAHKKSVWRRWAFFEKDYGTWEDLDAVLKESVVHCPHAEILWLMRAKETWKAGDISAAKQILESAFAANPNSEEIWLAAIKLEVETGEFERARELLKSARSKADTERVWMKSAVLERQLNKNKEALDLLDEALKKFPSFPKLWMIKGQILEETSIESARDVYSQGIKKNPKSIPLWILSSRVEEKAGFSIRARAVLEKARVMIPKTPELWMEAVRVEIRSGNTAMAKALMAKALQDVPNSGLLWSEAIVLEPRPARKAKSTDALKKCENDALVVSTIARLFWSERKYEKARNWFQRASKVDPDLGDNWAWWIKFESLHGTSESVSSILEKAVSSDPHHGEQWITMTKDIKNTGKSVRDLLQLLAAKLENTL